MITYEQKLDGDRWWGLEQGSLHFERASFVHQTLREFCRQLDRLDIPYAVIGAMALFFHGYRRFTEDVDLLVTEDGLSRIGPHLEQWGCLAEKQTRLRNINTGVRIDLMIAGRAVPGEPPERFVIPDPVQAVVIDGLRILDLAKLVELKLALGLSHPLRLMHIADVQALIAAAGIPESLADALTPFVREKYRELWHLVQTIPSEPPDWSRTWQSNS